MCIAGAIVLYWLLHETERVKGIYSYVAGVISPFVVGACLAFIINVPMRAIENRLQRIQKLTLRRIIAVLLTFIAGLVPSKVAAKKDPVIALRSE